MVTEWESPYHELRSWTLWELLGEEGIWSPFWDAPNCFPAETPRVELVEQTRRLLRELYRNGWVTLMRRPWTNAPNTDGKVLTSEEVEAAIRDDQWTKLPLEKTANVWLVPTPKLRAWQSWAAHDAFGGSEPEAPRVPDP